MNPINEQPADDVEFAPARLRGLPAHFEAQKIAFGPVVFQCVRTAWKSGLLAQLDSTGKIAASTEELAATSVLSSYAIDVLLESALSAGVVRRQAGRYSLTRVGDNILHDELTQINIDYIHYVCYQGLFQLEACLREEKPPCPNRPAPVGSTSITITRTRPLPRRFRTSSPASRAS